ncbi:VOC family protein [Thermomonas aquatica]|uniref:VOC family protein n=1 Tax=Thermomonas aquatica TaxID=2202149 RepID=A0A5B7ZSH5_9GAMM|nr:VOC family protein [Thermomonas aquatica]QDA57635.1 VOC family protein [Thermomonas aquatica]
MSIDHLLGAPTWFELGTSDQAAAEAFYSGLFGWTQRKTAMPDGSHYTIFQLDGRDVAACYTLMADMVAAGIPPHWGVYFKVADCDATVAQVRAHGGKAFCEPFEVMEHLRMATVGDPEGAAFNLHQPRAHPGVGVIREPNSVLWVELATRDIARAEAFYRAVLGWQATPLDAGPTQYRVLSCGGCETGFGGMLEMNQQWQGIPSHWSIYLHVADVDATLAQAVALGGKVCVPAFDVPGVGRIARIDDPGGAGCYVMTPSPRG